MEMIKSLVAPASWKEYGGPGHVQYYPSAWPWSFNQSRDVQEEVADLLRALRRLRDVEVCVEIGSCSCTPTTRGGSSIRSRAAGSSISTPLISPSRWKWRMDR